MVTMKVSDAEILDFLQEIMTNNDNYCEIYLAGLRNGGPGKASAYQFETNPSVIDTVNGTTLREAIIKAMKIRGALPDLQKQQKEIYDKFLLDICQSGQWKPSNFVIDQYHEFYWKGSNIHEDGFVYVLNVRYDLSASIICSDKKSEDFVFDGYITNKEELEQIQKLLRLP